MQTMLLMLTSKRTTQISIIMAVLLFLADAETIALLQEAFGLSEMIAQKVLSFSKLAVSLLAAAGYSPLKRPELPPSTGG